MEKEPQIITDWTSWEKEDKKTLPECVKKEGQKECASKINKLKSEVDEKCESKDVLNVRKLYKKIDEYYRLQNRKQLEKMRKDKNPNRILFYKHDIRDLNRIRAELEVIFYEDTLSKEDFIFLENSFEETKHVIPWWQDIYQEIGVHKKYFKEWKLLFLKDYYLENKENEEVIIEEIDNILDKPYANEILLRPQYRTRAFIEKAVQEHSLIIFEHNKFFEELPYIKELMIKKIDSWPRYAFTEIKGYEHAPYAKELLLYATKRSPFEAMANFEKIKHLSYAEEIRKIATTKENIQWHFKRGEQGQVVLLYEHYKDKPYAEEFLLKVANTNPYFIFAYVKEFKKAPFAKDVLITAGKKRPSWVFAYYHEYKDEPYAQEIIDMFTTYESLISSDFRCDGHARLLGGAILRSEI